MKELLLRSRRRMVVVLIGVLSAIILFATFVTAQIFIRIASTTEIIQSNRDEIAVLEERKRNVRLLKEKVDARIDDLEKVEEAFLKETDDVLPLIRMLEELARIDGVVFKVESAAESLKQQTDLPVETRYEIAGFGQGDFQASMKFLEHLEALPQRIIYKKLTIAPVGIGDKSIITFRFQILAF